MIEWGDGAKPIRASLAVLEHASSDVVVMACWQENMRKELSVLVPGLVNGYRAYYRPMYWHCLRGTPDSSM